MGLLSCPCLCISRAVAVAAAHYNLFEVVEVSKKFSDKHVGWHSFKAPSVSQREGDRGRSCRVVGKTKDIVIHKIYSSFQFNVINWPQLINAANTIQKPKRRFHADNKWMDRLEVCLWYYDDGDGPYNHADGYMRHIAKCAVILQNSITWLLGGIGHRKTLKKNTSFDWDEREFVRMLFAFITRNPQSIAVASGNEILLVRRRQSRFMRLPKLLHLPHIPIRVKHSSLIAS